MKVDRDPGRPVRHLEWRVRLMGVGAVLALAGMAMERAWMVNVAIAILAVGFFLRFIPGPHDGASGDTDSELPDSDPDR